MRVHELRADVVHIVRHTAQYGIGHGLGAVAALGLVAPELLNPLQVDDGHHTHQQVGVLGDIDLGRDDRAVQAFVEQQVCALGHLFPRSEGAGFLLVGRGLFGVVQVFSALAGARCGVVTKQGFQLGKQIVLRSKMAEVVVARSLGFGGLALHLGAVVAVKTVAFDGGGVHTLAAENVFEGTGHRSGSRTR